MSNLILTNSKGALDKVRKFGKILRIFENLHNSKFLGRGREGEHLMHTVT